MAWLTKRRVQRACKPAPKAWMPPSLSVLRMHSATPESPCVRDWMQLFTTSIGLFRTAETEPAAPPAKKVTHHGAAFFSKPKKAHAAVLS